MEQLGNIGSEVERAFRAHAQGRGDRFEHALARALELFDLTANDPRWRGHRCREVLRAREQFCRVFFDDAVEAGLSDYLRKYFLQFAVAARAQLVTVVKARNAGRKSRAGVSDCERCPFTGRTVRRCVSPLRKRRRRVVATYC